MCVKNKFERKTHGNSTTQSSTNHLQLYETANSPNNDTRLQPNPAYGTSKNVELQRNPAYVKTDEVVMDNDPDYNYVDKH